MYLHCFPADLKSQTYLIRPNNEATEMTLFRAEVPLAYLECLFDLSCPLNNIPVIYQTKVAIEATGKSLLPLVFGILDAAKTLRVATGT